MKQLITLGDFLFTELDRAIQEDMTYSQFVQLADPGRMDRSTKVRGPFPEIYASDNKEYHIFNFKSHPSTTGFRWKGYVAFKKPRNNQPKPAEQLAVEVECSCPDYRYRWAWANHQRNAGPIGRGSLNQCINKAPRITNPSGKPALCKHLLAMRRHILGLITQFPQRGKETDVDVSWKIAQLVKRAQHRTDNWDSEQDKARQRSEIYRQGQLARNVQGPMPQAEVPKNIDKETPVPLPPEGGTAKPAQSLSKPPVYKSGQKPSPKPLPQSSAKPASKKPLQNPMQKPTSPAPKKQGGENKKRYESLVVKPNSNAINMNTDLKKTLAIVEGMEDDLEHTSPGAEGAKSAAVPPQPGEDAEEMLPAENELPMEPGMGDDQPEDEALQLLRDINAGITRLAAELAPVDEQSPLEDEDFPAEEGAEIEDEDEDEGGVPPVDDEDDEFTENMPVSSGS